MRTGVSIGLSPSDRDRLDRIRKDRSAARKHAWWAGIILPGADGVGTNEIMRTGKSRTWAWRWQVRNKTCPARIPFFAPAIAEQAVARTLEVVTTLSILTL